MNTVIIGLVAFTFTMGPTLAHAAFTSTDPVDTVKADAATTTDTTKDLSTAVPKPTGDVTKEVKATDTATTTTDTTTTVPKPTSDMTKDDAATKAAKDKDIADEGDIGGCQANDTAAE